MKRVLTEKQAEEIDRISINDFHVPSEVLMERAALAVTRTVEGYYRRGMKVLAVCGSGNNGGDAVATARQLAENGICSDVYLCSENIKESLAQQLAIAEAYGLNIFNKINKPDFSHYDVIIDGIFGTGLQREVTGDYKDIVDEINMSGAYVVSVDIPSGIHAGSGELLGCAIKANETVTFGQCKVGHLLYPGAEYTGNLKVENIGFAPKAFDLLFNSESEEEKEIFICEESDLQEMPERRKYSNKGTYGKVLIVAGSANMGGAAILSASAAYRMGCGMVFVYTHESNKEAVLKNVPEAVMILYNEQNKEEKIEELKNNLGKFDVIVVGPGLSKDVNAIKLTETILMSAACPVIVDADALNICADQMKNGINLLTESSRDREDTVITPHILEMSRLIERPAEDINRNLLSVAKEASDKFNATVILKDARSVISDGSKYTVNIYGNSGMATAGSGDVLTGILAGIYAGYVANGERDKLGFKATSYACMIHGMAGECAAEKLGERCMLASDIVQGIIDVIK